jgi:hypothetical protein
MNRNSFDGLGEHLYVYWQAAIFRAMAGNSPAIVSIGWLI